MSFGLFAVLDKDAHQVCREIRRVLKPGGQSDFHTVAQVIRRAHMDRGSKIRG